MGKKALALILLLLLSIAAGFHLVDRANCRGTLIVVVNSPQNRTYNSNDISLSVSATDPELLTGPESIAYSLDGGPQTIIATVQAGLHSLSEITMLSVPDGSHSIVGVGITWFNGTADGIFYSSPVYFTVDTNSNSSSESQLTETSLTLSILVSVIFMIIFSVIVVIYFKKRKH